MIFGNLVDLLVVNVILKKVKKIHLCNTVNFEQGDSNGAVQTCVQSQNSVRR